MDIEDLGAELGSAPVSCLSLLAMSRAILCWILW